ncbi:RsmB/NOP family class I SAM-dependent RNA methyltransferase [Nocardioides donggukensis]|uniref:rRNA cytosine-C5-methyltransferase n=1 Tax=Nocardioides donggukensis TaxID=2774019 RepID=A0A927K8I5_9ACTN|nr:transcription antitermination factor NusB [Nocardioides donggukensis]MBD8869726.1 rRNA cytosine-C5-methyltransferase [Nocardioides donggukensis]
MADPRRRGQRGRRSGGRPPARAGVDAPRAAAYEVLRAVRVDDAYTNLALPPALERHGLSGRDAAFATELASGTLRRRGTYDLVLAACIDRPLAKVEAKVLDALRLGAHQLLSMRVPAHAAISTTVDLVRARAGGGPAGFANAVLRRVSERDLADWVRLVAPADPRGFAAVAHAHPRWVVDALAEALGPRADELDDLLAADNAAPRVTLVARPGLAEVAELVAAGGTASPQSPYAVELAGGDPGAVPAVGQGRAGVQDEGSQLVALALASLPLEGADDTWLDLCAGPGGKATLLAAMAAQRGARLLAVERAPHRAGLVRRSTRPASPGMLGVVAADGTVPAWASDRFDRVLVDAPCTGLGALRRRPEARWRRTPEDLTDLVPLQRSLLSAAVTAARSGGVVAYATCSPVLAETVGVVEAVLAERGDAELVDASGLLPGVTDAGGPLPGTLQLWPHRHGTDAMFVALLRRRPGDRIG